MKIGNERLNTVKMSLRFFAKHQIDENPTTSKASSDLGSDDDNELFNTVDDGGDSSDSEGEVESDEGFDGEVEAGEDDLEESEEEDVEDDDDDEDSDGVDSESSDDEQQEESSDNDGAETEKESPIKKTLPPARTIQTKYKKGSKSKTSTTTTKAQDVFDKNTHKTQMETTTMDEYDDYDTSDEEDIRNTVGNIPMMWYNEYRHLGYDWDGKQIMKPESGDNLDNFLKRMEDPDFWRTVKDPQTGQSVVLNENDLKLIRRIHSQQIPDETYDEYAPWIEWFTSEVMKTPIRKFPEHKRSFLPSKHEARQVSRIVHALKMGWMKTKEEQDRLRAKHDPQFYDLWGKDTDDADENKDVMRQIHKHIPPPKRLLPGHAESYNPPAEYLFDAREMKRWNKENDPWKRRLHFVPKKFDALRNVPAYGRYIKERFLRCMDLYLCPRAYKMKLQIAPEDLVPKLPSPRDLQPFPTTLAIEYVGHTDMVRSISVDRTGQYLVSGSDDETMKIWEVNTGRCLKTLHTEGVVRSVAWCPNAALSLILIAADSHVIVYNPHVGDHLICSKTDTVLGETPNNNNTDVIVSERVRATVNWTEPDVEQSRNGCRFILKHFKTVTHVTWHGKGDYFAAVMPDGQHRSVLISQVSKRRSQLPFGKSKGLVQTVLFHPSKPFLMVATQRHVRIYDLVKQSLLKKLMTNSKWIASMAIHPGGDNLLVGTYDRKVLWFDLDLSTKPYQTLRLHGTAVRGVAYHRRYPLFATGSDDRSLIVSHGMVYNDLLKNPLIVPLKRLQDHKPFNDFGIFDVVFHPLQPWVFSAGADATVKLYSN